MASDLPARVRFARRMAAGDASLRLYAILDYQSCVARRIEPVRLAAAWRRAGVCLMQYRDKQGSDAEVLRRARAIGEAFRSDDNYMLLNDRTHLLRELGWDGVHIGQGDGGVKAARTLVGDDAIVGCSTHEPGEAVDASREDVDYVAIGPVYGTRTKLDASTVVGLCGAQAVRAVVQKPLVAIGGITLGNTRAVRQTGADAVAVISALLQGGSAEQTARDFLAQLK